MNIAYVVCLGLEVILGLLLILVVLLHAPKGEGMGGIGGTATLFSSRRGAESGLDHLAYIIGGLFMLVCAILGFGFVHP
jgi:preprotein translocase subunit SecG